MFDDIPQKNSAPPENLPTEPMDMFAGIENGHEVIPGTSGPSAVDAGILKKKTSSAVQSLPPGMNELSGGYAVRGPVLGKVIMVIIILAIAGGAGYGSWRLYSYLNSGDGTVAPAANNSAVTGDTQTPPVQTPDASPTDTASGTVVAPATTSAETDMNQDEILFGEPIDTDKDGLDDVREEELGTNMTKIDTDSDNLNDGDEVLIWKTDPKNPDTDGDSYLDGDEVTHGYNPLGPGKLLFNGQPSATGTAPASVPVVTTTPAVGATATPTVPFEDIAI